MEDERILEIAHRTASTYAHRSDPKNHSYAFMKHTLLDFARKVIAEAGGLPPMKDETITLPEPAAWLVASCLQWLTDPARTASAYTYPEMTRRDPHDGLERAPMFTADQVRAAVLQAKREERELWQRDAERYRWLRQQHWSDAPLCVVASPQQAVKLGHDCPSMERLDEEVDAAIRSGHSITETTRDGE